MAGERLHPGGDGLLMARRETAAADEGMTRTTLIPSVDPTEAQTRATLRRLTMNGGGGDPTVANVGGAVLTVRENVAVAIARDMADDATRRHGVALAQLTLLQLNEGIGARCRGRGTTVAQVGAELARLQNVAIYGSEVRRR